jgi:hypothetical protein
MIFHRTKRSMRDRSSFAWWMQNFFRSIWMLKDMRSENMWRCILRWILKCILSWIRDWIRSWIRSWIWSKWSCKWDCKWKRVRRKINLKKSYERKRRWWLKINLFIFFSRQRDQILLDIEKKNFEINVQYFIIKNLISAYEMMWDECVMLISFEISSTISSEIDTVISFALMQYLQNCQFLCRLILTCYAPVLSTGTPHLATSPPLPIKQACLAALVTLQPIGPLDPLTMLRPSASGLGNEQEIPDESSTERSTKRSTPWYSHHGLETA